MGDAQTALRTVQEFGGDATNISRLIERAKADVARGEYDKGFNSLRQARQEGEEALGKGLQSPRRTHATRQGDQLLQKAQFDKVLLTIGASREKFVTAKSIGADITPAIEHLNRARGALQAGQFKDALAASKKA